MFLSAEHGVLNTEVEQSCSRVLSNNLVDSPYVFLLLGFKITTRDEFDYLFSVVVCA